MELQQYINQPAKQPPNEAYSKLASNEQIERTSRALQNNGIEAFVVENSEAAKEKIFDLILIGVEIVHLRYEPVPIFFAQGNLLIFVFFDDNAVNRLSVK